MARINLEDSLNGDPRFLKLVIKTQCEYKALGILVSAWKLAQKHWLKHRGIPAKAWPKELDILVELEFAEIKKSQSADSDLIYVKGSRKQFAWLEHQSEAGKVGGQVKSDAKAKAARENSKRGGRKKQTQADDSVDPNSNISGEKPKPNPSQAKPSQASLLFTPSSSSLLSSQAHNSDSSSNVPEPKRKKPVAPRELTSAIWEAYRASYLARYKVEPVRNASVNSKISQIALRLGSEATEVVKFFLSHNKSFYVGKLHDIGLCLYDAEALRTQWLRGKAVTENDVKRFSQNQNDHEVMMAIKEGRV